MSNFINGIKSFVHSISTSDHYATYDPSKPAAPQEEQAPLTTAAGSEAAGEPGSRRNSGYVPGMRTAQLGGGSPRGSQEQNPQDNIPLADMAPIPAPDLSWTRIDDWIESHYPELHDQLQYGATENDLNDLERDLDCVLPSDVRESYLVHDGQEHGGKPTGVFFGITLLDIEDISEEWNIWRRAALRLDELAQRQKPEPSSSNGAARRSASRDASLAWIENQASCPPEHVQPLYAHPAWIPLAKDYDGNNIAVDLAPGPKGHVGQVILFGRDFDTKYVVSPSWGDFLAQFAADLESGNSYIDDDIEDAVFAFKLPAGQLVSYFNVLKQRVLRTQPRPPPSAPTAHAVPSAPPHSAAHGPAPGSSHGPPHSASHGPLHNAPHHAPNAHPHARRHAPQPRMNVSVSHAPVNSGRVTQRLTSPNQVFRSGAKDSRRSSRGNLIKDMNEVDLSGKPESGAEKSDATEQPSARPAAGSTSPDASREDASTSAKAHESGPEPSEDSAAESTAETAAETTAETTPETAPETTPEAAPDAAEPAVPEVASESTAQPSAAPKAATAPVPGPENSARDEYEHDVARHASIEEPAPAKDPRDESEEEVSAEPEDGKDA